MLLISKKSKMVYYGKDLKQLQYYISYKSGPYETKIHLFSLIQTVV